MAIGDVIGSEPGPWWYDTDGHGTKSREYPTRGAAAEAGRAFAAAVVNEKSAEGEAVDVEEAAGASKTVDDWPSVAEQAAYAAWRAGQGR